MITLRSYVSSAWTEGQGDPRTLYDPSTEEPLAIVRPAGVDPAAVLAHARERGLPALQRLGFRGRAEVLRALSALLHERRDELIDISAKNGGNTRGDAKFDIDGATGTLAFYASLGKNLPETNHLPDGDGVQLGRTARFWGQHLLVPRPGVAVHVNAFNFPAWGMGEKLAWWSRAASCPRVHSSSSPARSAPCSTASGRWTASPSPAARPPAP
jgi:3,4-dehydroadipyl-CoA semialdehyde dehydrogenase